MKHKKKVNAERLIINTNTEHTGVYRRVALTLSARNNIVLQTLVNCFLLIICHYK